MTLYVSSNKVYNVFSSVPGASAVWFMFPQGGMYIGSYWLREIMVLESSDTPRILEILSLSPDLCATEVKN